MQNAGRPGELGRPNDLPNPQKEKRRREVIRKGEDFLLTLKSNSSTSHRTFCGASFCSLRLSPTPFLSGLRAISRASFKNCSWDRTFKEISLRTLSLDYVLIIAHLFRLVKGFSHFFLIYFFSRTAFRPLFSSPLDTYYYSRFLGKCKMANSINRHAKKLLLFVHYYQFGVITGITLNCAN